MQFLNFGLTVLAAVTLPVLAAYLVFGKVLDGMLAKPITSVERLESVRRTIRVYWKACVGTFVISESGFAAIYFAIQVVLLPFKMAAALVQRKSLDFGLGGFVVGTIVVAAIVFWPYFRRRQKLSDAFKLAALSLTGQAAGSAERFTLDVSAQPERVGFRAFVSMIVGRDQLRNAVRNCLGNHQRKAKLSVSSEDVFTLERPERRLQLWESSMHFVSVEEERYRNSKGEQKTRTTTLHEEALFDGLCIRGIGVLDAPTSTRLFQCQDGQDIRGDRHSGPRPIAGGFNLGSKSYEAFSSGSISASDLDEQVPVNGVLGTLDRDLMYVVADRQDVFLFIQTGMKGNLFEFDLERSASESVAIFQSDLAFCRRHAELLERVLPVVQAACGERKTLAVVG